jgi:hypothetical protein
MPGAPGLTYTEVDRCVAHLPNPNDVPVGRFILSGGEPLVWPELLFHTLSKLYARYHDASALWLQTNGDYLDEKMLERLLAHHVTRVDVSGMDNYHRHGDSDRRDTLESMFKAHGMRPVSEAVVFNEKDDVHPRAPLYHFWGCTPETWIGPIWPRGRAWRHGLSKAGPKDRFCAMWSGGLNFLNYRERYSEINLQIEDVYPCCPMTIAPIGSLLDAPLIDILDQCAQHPVFQSLNEGNPEDMGTSFGVSEVYGRERSDALGNHCLWCDEFFQQHAPSLLYKQGRTTRGNIT